MANDLVILSGNNLPKCKDEILGARALPQLHCPVCHKNNGQGMDGWLGAECRLYFKCPDCGCEQVAIKKYPGSTFMHDMFQIQREFSVYAWSEMQKQLTYEKTHVAEIEVLPLTKKKINHIDLDND